MKILVTGASGYIGNKLAHMLAGQGKEVHALIRSHEQKKLLEHKNISIFIGDVQQRESITKAMEGCRQVYHTAGKVGAWAKNSSMFYDVNVEGTRNVLAAATRAGVEKLVFTSTSGVLGPTHETPLTENHSRQIDFAIDYDRSKKIGEDVVFEYLNKGVNSVVVSPSKVYGPGKTSHSLTANAVIDLFLRKRITFIPSPGTYKVCFAYINDVVNGHILAMEKGTPGERYILGGINISYYDFFNTIRSASGTKGVIIKLPKSIVKQWAYFQQVNYKLTGSPIRFPVNSVNHAFSNYIFSSQKAIDQLGYQITPLNEALTKTIQFLQDGSNE